MSNQMLQSAFSFHQQGRLQAAIDACGNVLRVDPKCIDALNLMGVCYCQLGAAQDGIRCFRKSLRIRPDWPASHAFLGEALCESGAYKEALLSLQRAIALDPCMADAHTNQGYVLHELGRYAEAVLCYKKAIELRPDLFGTHNHLGNTLLRLGRQGEAEACFRGAIELAPEYPPPYSNLCVLLVAKGSLLEAEQFARRALALAPADADAQLNLGVALRLQGRYREAEASFSEALRLKPNSFDAYSNLLFVYSFVEGVSAEQYLARARECGRMLAAHAAKPFASWRAEESPHRLRVGIVSGDLRMHPVGYFLESVLQALDHERVELFAYPTSMQSDALTDQLRRSFSAWSPVAGKTDRVAAEMIRKDGIHVLLDLSGYTAASRLPIFAWKPAPVQASWLGYFASTGLAEMDFILADPVCVPESQCAQFSESVWYLPETRLCFSEPVSAPLVQDLPALSGGSVTFGCFQNLAKLGEEVLALWAAVLVRVPGSRMRFQGAMYDDPVHADRLKARMAAHGVEASRLLFRGAVSRNEFLSAHNEVDLILDTFPYPGGTTTCEALWMGVPTLTLAGGSMLARQGAGLLVAAGLPDWVAYDRQEYLQKAVMFASDLPALAALRAQLRDQMRSSPLFAAPRFARHLENALWGMWHAKMGQ